MSIPKPAKPNSAGAYKISGGGFEVSLPNLIFSDDEPISLESYFENIEGRDGALSVRSPNFTGRAITLSGRVFDAQTTKSLRQVLSYKRVVLEREDLVLPAEVQAISIVEDVTNQLWNVEIELLSAKYYWESKVPYVSPPNSGVALNFGSAPTFPIFTIPAPEGGLFEVKFQFNGFTVEWENQNTPIPFGKTLVIDCENLTAVTEDGSVTGFMNDEFFVKQPFFPANSSIVVVSSLNDGTPFTPEPLLYDGEVVEFGGLELYYYPFPTGYTMQFFERYL